MTPLSLDIGIFFFEYLKVLVAFLAVVLAVRWKKTEFLAGLFFLLLWCVLDAVYVTFLTFTTASFVNASEFGFILLAIISFILGMRPAREIPFPAK